VGGPALSDKTRIFNRLTRFSGKATFINQILGHAIRFLGVSLSQLHRRHYGDLIRLSEEGIASNVLADRLARLGRAGLLSRISDPTHKQKAIYSLTEASMQQIPLLAHIGAWGQRYTPASKELSIRSELLEEGGERIWKAFMAELRSLHLGAPRRSVFAELQMAFESAVKQQAVAGK
jgi:DNA-binding HxlR family transcriptional regulator